MGRVLEKIKQQQGGAKRSEIPKFLFHRHLQMGIFNLYSFATKLV
jgi:hypothetical protein